MTARLAVLFLLFVFRPASAAEADPGAEARARMAALSGLIGEFRTVTEFSSDGGATWESGAPRIVRVELVHNGLVLRERTVQKDGPGFDMLQLLTFDQYRGVFRKAAIDDTWGLMDVYEGVVDGDALVLDNLRSGTTFPTEDGERHFRLTIELHSGHRTMRIDASEDGGETWRPNFRVRYAPLGTDGKAPRTRAFVGALTTTPARSPEAPRGSGPARPAWRARTTPGS